MPNHKYMWCRPGMSSFLATNLIKEVGLFRDLLHSIPKENRNSWSKAAQPGVVLRSERNVFLGIP